MFPTIVNCFTVIIGSLLGLVIKDKINDNFKEVISISAGLSTFVIGLSMALQTQSYLILLFSLVIGGLLGYALRIEDKILAVGKFLESKTAKGKKGTSTFSYGFLNASVLFCSGAMSIVGSIHAGTVGDYQIILVKSVLDGSMAIVFSAAYGIGVMFSAITILVYQGFFTLAGSYLSPLLGEAGLTELSSSGGLLIMMIALSLLDLKKIKTGNFLLSMFIAPLLVAISPYITKFIPLLAS